MINIEKLWKLVKNAEFVEIGFVSEGGTPNIRKTFIQREYRSLDRHFISTNTSSFHVGQLAKNSRACLYYSNEKAFEAVCFYGEAVIHHEREYKEFFWHSGDERYYPKGIDDEDYCIIEFRAEYGEYYHNGEKHSVTADEIKNSGLKAEPFPYV